MAETIEINGVKYMMQGASDKLTLQRYNEAHKIWVNLHFPTGNQAEKARLEDEIIQILSNQYIERNTQSNGRDLHLLSPEG